MFKIVKQNPKWVLKMCQHWTKFLELSGWQPDKLAVFAGRIDYPSYRFLDRLIIRFIMLITKGPTDTSQTYEFTDWNKVANFAKEVL